MSTSGAPGSVLGVRVQVSINRHIRTGQCVGGGDRSTNIIRPIELHEGVGFDTVWGTRAGFPDLKEEAFTGPGTAFSAVGREVP